MKIAEMFDKRKNCYSVRTGIHNCWFSLPWMEWNGTSCSSFQPSSSRSKKFIASTFFDNFRNETTWVWGETKWNKNQRETLELVWDGSSQTRSLFSTWAPLLSWIRDIGNTDDLIKTEKMNKLEWWRISWERKVWCLLRGSIPLPSYLIKIVQLSNLAS